MKSIIVALATLSLPLMVSAAPALNEIQIGVVGNGRFVSEKVGSDTVSTLQARGSYAFGEIFERDEVQVGGEAQIISTSGGPKSRTGLDLAGFLTWNFDTTFDRAFYAKGGLGTFSYLNTALDYENKIGVFAGLGKRFPLFTGVWYNPEGRIYKKDGVDASIEIMFLNVSILF